MPQIEQQDTDLIRVVEADHRAFEAAFRELEASAGEPVGRKALVDHVIAELVRHTVVQEQFVHPVVRRVFEDGEAVVERELEAYAEAEALMKALESKGPADLEFEPLLARLIAGVRAHVADEEARLLPRLAAACDAEELQDLGFKVQAAKAFAPTRPHPHAPDTTPANLVVGPGVGFIDHIRDALANRDV
ncbi:hemerythrin domain-containing protein [Glycomyces terrestris]|uniref:Hemerythrin domain-containing protein n=1 Tax=Glycomyces terrestris TaxID=2493553 RepID=A0A426V507_9ACTN|nr:hemerythrin domain-containing protein [Glycomyces terrestris]RRS01952.1 hemerythrin domain-containing protein [Glycomyces terrestris]